MWQEDFDHALCRALSWQACHLRLSELLASDQVTDEPETAAADDDEVIYCFQLLSRDVLDSFLKFIWNRISMDIRSIFRENDHTGKCLVRETSFWENDYPGNTFSGK